MNGITFAEPLFLYLLAVVPVMIAFYIFKQQKANASIRMPGLQPFAQTGKTFRHYLRHILFRFPYCMYNTSYYSTCPSSGNRQIPGYLNRRY